ncbi:MAG: HPF/RaiA family ribosome-associated protein [Methylovirgula sp.]|nr:HPF/RaiA family ribosome-associated protein [Methylovirgula sp.]
MQVPIQISFRNCEPSEQIRSEIEKEAQHLEKFYNRITACNVAVTAPNLLHHRQGGLFKIDLRIALPQHKDIIVNKTHGDVHQHEHISVAIRDAFAAAQRQVEDAVRHMRGDVKQDLAPDRGRVSKLIAGEDYGFIETSDGREIYFHRNSVLDDAFDRLRVGAEVRFVEEAGEKGSQASTVRLAA